MARPFLLVQLSDPHLGADWGGGDPIAGLAETVADTCAFAPDAVLISGDLADHGADGEYEQVRGHHPPLLTGIAGFDDCALRPDDQRPR